MRDPEGRAHHAARLRAAGGDADTPPGGPGEVAAVGGQYEASVASQRGRRSHRPKILVQRLRAYSNARIQLSRRVPQRLELLEHREHRLTEDLRLHLASSLPVAVLARRDATVRHHEARRLPDEPP